MVKLYFDPLFRKTLKKLDAHMKKRVKKQIKKIMKNPEIGKPMRFARRGTRELYISPYRLSYAYISDDIFKKPGKSTEEKIIFLALYHKDAQ